MQIKKQILGYNCQQVEQFLAATEKQDQDQLNNINARIIDCQQKNQKRIADLAVLLRQVEECREYGQAFMEPILELVKALEDAHSQADQNIDAAQKHLVDKLAELSNSYRIIEDIKHKLAASHQQLESLQQS